MTITEGYVLRLGFCYDCHVDGGLYMVHDHVWKEAWPEYKELKAVLKARHSVAHLCLCFPCLERRLKRSLVVEDFTEAGINTPIFFGYRLMTQLEKARNLGKSIANDMFATMLNPKYRGTQFKWSKLEDTVRDLVKTSFDMHLPCPSEEQKALIAIALEEASLEVRQLLRKSGVEQWLPL